MKKAILLFFICVLLFSCKKEYGQINLAHNRFSQDVYNLRIYSKDTLVYEAKIPFHLMEGDTLKLEKLPSGTYTMSYLDLLGKVKTDEIILKGGEIVFAEPRPDTVNVNSFYIKTPINNIKDGERYLIRSKGGCVATLEGWYTVYRENNKIYFEPTRGKKRLLKKNEVKAVKHFEAELLAINGVNICNSTARMTYTIEKTADTLRIIDNTCMWNGWRDLMRELYR